MSLTEITISHDGRVSYRNSMHGKKTKIVTVGSWNSGDSSVTLALRDSHQEYNGQYSVKQLDEYFFLVRDTLIWPDLKFQIQKELKEDETLKILNDIIQNRNGTDDHKKRYQEWKVMLIKQIITDKPVMVKYKER
jgi:hypothetical protein